MRMFAVGLLFCVGIVAADPVPSKEPLPLKDFARIDGYSSAKISPDGAYLALLVPIEEQLGLMVVDLATNKIVAKFSAGVDRSIYNYVWAGSRRLVAELADRYGSVDYAVSTGELFAVDIDGKNSIYLFGFRGGSQIGSHINRVTRRRGSARIIRSLPEDPDHVVIAVHNWDEGIDSEYATTYLLNVHTGLLDHETSAPVTGPARFAADRKGFVRYALVQHELEHLLTFSRAPEQPEWKAVNRGDLGKAKVVPVGWSNDVSTVYLNSDEGGDFSCLVKLDVASGVRTKLSCEPGTDLAGTLFSFDYDAVPVAAVFDSGMPTIKWLDTDNPSRTLLEDLQKAFPGQRAWPVSHTLNGEQALIEVSSDRNPGDYYLLDTRTHKAAYLISEFDWIDPERMAERRPMEFPARDGQLLHAIMTMPLGPDARKQPLVVMPHGGPFDIRDTWYWQRSAQALASRGYTVLQVNFRGSGGYGQRFIEAGRHGWNQAMIDDITDGTRWAIAQGYADPARVCIFGASYGGYAALMSAVREPDLYRCTIGYAGVYDLARWKRDSDVGDSEIGRTYIADFVGADARALRDASPITYIDRLKAAVMIVHGEEDARVPFNQAKLLRSALEARHYPYEWLVRPGEGHGFYLPKNRLALYEQVIAFLDRNIGAQSQPTATAATASEAPARSADEAPK